MTTKELKKRIDEQNDRQNRLDKLYQKHDQNIIDLARAIDKLTDDVEKVKYILRFINPKSLETKSVPHEFKVGDRVQFKSDDKINIGIIDDFLREYVYVKSDGLIYSMKIDQIKPATDEPECKFKVGDRVKVRCYGNATKCTITEINGNKATIFIDETTEFGGSTYSITEDITDLEPYTEPRWTFTDDEKVILRNLPEKYKWIARDKGEGLWVHEYKPRKLEYGWRFAENCCERLDLFNNLFQSIKWEDEEPCEFRKFI